MILWNGVNNYGTFACIRRRDDSSSQCSSVVSSSSSSTTTTAFSVPSAPTYTSLPNFNLVFDEETSTNLSQTHCYSDGFYETTNSYDDSNFNGDPGSWCTGRCGSKLYQDELYLIITCITDDSQCESVFVFRASSYPQPFFTCNQ